MIFALGFLLASLCALLFVPVLSARAMRLAQRRIDGRFPLSVKEIIAERDALRAEFAVAQRRMERKVAEAQAKCHADMQTLGSRELEVAELARGIESRDVTLNDRKLEIERTVARIAELDHDLAGIRTEHATGLAALTALEDAHREILADLKSTRRERDKVRQELQDAIATEEGSEAHERNNERIAHAAEIAKATASLQDLRAQYDTVTADRDTLRASLRAAEEALAKAAFARSETDPRDDAELRRKITEVADALTRGDRLPAVGAFPRAAGS